MSRLRVVVDGRALPEPEARATWERFSAHMDVHRGDFAGFAESEGYASASVSVAGDVPTLTLSNRPEAAASSKAPPSPKREGPAKRRKRKAGRTEVDAGDRVPRRKKRG